MCVVNVQNDHIRFLANKLSNSTRIRPVLVIFVLKCSLPKNCNFCYIFRRACLFWSKQATNILINIKLLLLMVQFYNAPSYANVASGRQALTIRAHNLFQNNGKRNWFHKIGPIMKPAKKNGLQDFYDIFYLHVQETR